MAYFGLKTNLMSAWPWDVEYHRDQASREDIPPKLALRLGLCGVKSKPCPVETKHPPASEVYHNYSKK